MNQQTTSNNVVSPCVSICALDDDDVCVGCHRTGAEITEWGAMNNAQKLAVMEKVRERESGSYI
jgi:hypothetical protein